MNIQSQQQQQHPSQRQQSIAPPYHHHHHQQQQQVPNAVPHMIPSSSTTAAADNDSRKRPYNSMDNPAVQATVTAPPSSSSATNTNTTTTKTRTGEPLSEKKLRRLEKNRLSARECRRRKREATELMERQINLLEGENLRLRLQLQVGEEAEESTFQEQQKLTEGLDSLLKSGASESEIYAKIEEYKEKFADYGRDRRSAIEFHLRNVERLLMPTQTTSVVLATLSGGNNNSGGEQKTAAGWATSDKEAKNEQTKDASADKATVGTNSSTGVNEASATTNSNEPSSPSLAPPKDNKALFQHLVNILEVTPEQAAALKDSRFVSQEMDEILKETLSVLTELRTRLTQCGEDLETEFNNVRAILTPSQSAKFLVWVSQNKACMHMLNELWSKVYPMSYNKKNNDRSGIGGFNNDKTTNENDETNDDIGEMSGGEQSP